jgi:MoxR-like ATPase
VAWARQILDQIDRAVVGKRTEVELALTTAVAGGHLLLEDAPGVGKTSLARALAQALGLSFARIQCTSDLLPTDVLGVTVLGPEGRFEFRPGPIFRQLVLVDELNRASPRTQSALLEAMAEGAVSLEGEPRRLPTPFLVIATQNPHEHAGTYPLPDSQLDRFLLRLTLGYPPPDAERRLIQEDGERQTQPELPPGDPEALVHMQEQARRVRIGPEVADYLARIAEATRLSDQLLAGASTRGALLLARAARARALLRGRDYVMPDDVKALGVACFAHRVTPQSGRAGAGRRETEALLRDLIERVPVP